MTSTAAATYRSSESAIFTLILPALDARRTAPPSVFHRYALATRSSSPSTSAGAHSRGGFLALRGTLYQLVLQHFAAGVRRQGIDEVDMARPLEAREFPVRAAEVVDRL